MDDPPVAALIPLLQGLWSAADHNSGLGENTAPPHVFPAALAAWTTDRHRARLPGQPWVSKTHVAELVSRYRRALCLSNDESESLRDHLVLLPGLVSEWDSLGVAAKKRLAARPIFPTALAILAADNRTAADHIQLAVVNLSADGIGLGPPPIMTGDDLVLAGHAPGPRFKRVLEEVYNAQLEGRIRDKAAALELARRLGV